MNPSSRTPATQLPGDPTTVLTVTALAGFLATFMGSSINTALPLVGSEFQAPTMIPSWTSLDYIVAAGAVLMPVGRLADLCGGKPAFISVALTLAPTGILRPGFAFFASPMIHSVMDSVDRRHCGVASATLGTMRLTGQNISRVQPQTPAGEGASP